jgi:hypothetical protein
MKDTWPSIGAISSKVAATILDRLLALRIEISEKYLQHRASTGTRYSITLLDYLSHEGWAKENRMVCPEDYAPHFQDLLSDFTLNDLFGSMHTAADRVGVHAAYGGSVTPLHFDSDNSCVQHLCLSGKRTVWLCPPAPRRSLATSGNSVLMDFEEIDIGQREQTLIEFGADRFELAAGDFVRFPSFWWHLVEYSEVSVALSIRSEYSALARPMTILPRSPELQYLFQGLLSAPDAKQIDVIAKLIREVLSFFDHKISAKSYLERIREAQEDLELIPTCRNVSVEPVDTQWAKRFQAAKKLHKAETEESKLCREWLFGHWPQHAPLSDEDAAVLVRLMTCAMSPSHSEAGKELL